MSGAVVGLGKVFKTVGSTVSKVASSVGTIGKTAFTALTAQAAPSLAQGGASAITGYSNTGALGNVLGNAVKQTGYGSIDAAQSFGQANAFNAAPLQQVAKPTGFASMLNSPMAANVIQGLGAGLSQHAERQFQANESQKQLDFQQNKIDQVRDSYSVNPDAYNSSAGRGKPRFAYNSETGQIEHN